MLGNFKFFLLLNIQFLVKGLLLLSITFLKFSLDLTCNKNTGQHTPICTNRTARRATYPVKNPWIMIALSKYLLFIKIFVWVKMIVLASERMIW